MWKRSNHRRLRPGDVVEVKSPAEILRTLDAVGSTDGMPFMPEMLAFVGKRFTVSRRVEKVCDTVSGNYGSRRMRNTVFLDDLRCNGSAHGGCQALCRLYWNEAWLRPVADPRPALSVGYADELERRVRVGSRPGGATQDVYRCQATEALAATTSLGRYDLRQFVREIWFGNIGVKSFVRVAARALWTRLQQRVGRYHWTPLAPTHLHVSPSESVRLEPGDLVRVRRPEQIAATLDAQGKNKALWFDREMLPFCGKEFRVKTRVHRIIDEATGRLIVLNSDCLILDGVACSGEHSPGRWMCPRAIYPFWREVWLDPVTTEHATHRVSDDSASSE